MSPKQISYLAFACLLLIFSTQAYLVFDYFQTTRAGLVRESDTILQEAFKTELNIRHNKFQYLMGEENVIVPPPPTKENTIKADFSTNSDLKGNILGVLDLAINKVVSNLVPMDIAHLDSITGRILKSRNINADYALNIIDKKTDKVRARSKDEFHSSIFYIQSKQLVIDYEKNESLQLILVNPFGLIIKRMSLMLISSLVLSIICMFAFRFLQRILAKQKQLVAFKNDFLSTIAHELKRPVASLSFNLDCLSMPAFIDDKSKHELLVNSSMNATVELNSTINMIVALARLEEGLLTLNKEPINLSKLFEELRGKFVSYPVKKVDIQTVYETNDVSVTGDANLLSQCFANLIDNAIKYSNNEVLIIITIRKTGRWIVVSIKDNGFGIPEEKLPVIFDKYSRAHAENTKINGFGIGLNYVKTIVEKHRGEVAVESQSGEGTVFSVSLPE
jgi:two-component system phosphate regulon sensor histidine kinase PhoR